MGWYDYTGNSLMADDSHYGQNISLLTNEEKGEAL